MILGVFSSISKRRIRGRYTVRDEQAFLGALLLLTFVLLILYYFVFPYIALVSHVHSFILSRYSKFLLQERKRNANFTSEGDWRRGEKTKIAKKNNNKK